MDEEAGDTRERVMLFLSVLVRWTPGCQKNQ